MAKLIKSRQIRPPYVEQDREDDVLDLAAALVAHPLAEDARLTRMHRLEKAGDATHKPHE
jgi:hypothetical protein